MCGFLSERLTMIFLNRPIIYLAQSASRCLEVKLLLLLFGRKAIEESALLFSILLAIQAEIQSG